VKIFTYIKEDSNRIEKKNFCKIGDLELWKHLIYELNKLNCDIFIDTDSLEIIESCKTSNPHLSNVTAYSRLFKFIRMENDPNNKLSPAILMLESFLDNHIEDENETIVLTHVTSPFLRSPTVTNAVKLYEEGQYEFIHSVNVEKNFAFLGGFDSPINFDPLVLQRTQDLEQICFSNGAFFIFNKKTFKRHNHRWGESIYFYPLPPVQGIEVDYPEDLELARIVYRGMK